MIQRRTATVDAQERRPERPFPEVERRMRAVFPELWERYEALAATMRGHGRKHRRIPIGSA